MSQNRLTRALSSGRAVRRVIGSFSRALFAVTVAVICCSKTYGEEGVLVVHVADPLGQPIAGVVLSATGDSSSSAFTDVTGKTRIQLAPQTRPGSEITLQVVRAPQDLVFISPWNQRVIVRSFENESQNVTEVVLAQRGSRMLLEYPPAQFAFAAKVNAANAAAASREMSDEVRRRASLAEVAKAFGYSPEQVDNAIRNLAKKSRDAYQLGQVALYERDYAEAEKQLLKSKADRKNALADVSFSLGQTYYEQARYKESVKEFEEAAALRPDDCCLLMNLGVALTKLEQYQEAELVLKKAIAIREKEVPDHLDVATGLIFLAEIYRINRRYVEAEPLFKRALAIRTKRKGPEHLDVANALTFLADFYREIDRYEEAEPLYKRALAIRKKQQGVGHLDVSSILTDLALLYQREGRYAEAEQSFKEALAIREKLDNSDLSSGLMFLAEFYGSQRRYGEAEPLIKRALRIRETQLGPEHLDVAAVLLYLARLYQEQGKYAESETLFKRVLKIRETQLGPEHSLVAESLHDLGRLYRGQNNFTEAEQMFKRALAINEKLFGPEDVHPSINLRELALLYRLQGRYGEAEPLMKRALAIEEKYWGPEHAEVATSLLEYAQLLRQMNRISEAEAMEARGRAIRAKQKR